VSDQGQETKPVVVVLAEGRLSWMRSRTDAKEYTLPERHRSPQRKALASLLALAAIATIGSFSLWHLPPAYAGGPPPPPPPPPPAAACSAGVLPQSSNSNGSVSYLSGWNIVGGPAGTVMNTQGPLYTYQPRDTAYEVIPSGAGLQAGFGYWAYFSQSAAVTLPQTAAQTITVTLPAAEWVLVGNPGLTSATVSGADCLYVYTPGSAYSSVTVLAPGQGGWAMSLNGGSVTISPASGTTSTVPASNISAPSPSVPAGPMPPAK